MMACGCLGMNTPWNSTCPLAKPHSRREQSWLMLRAETAPKSAPVALVPRQSRRAWLVSPHEKEQEPSVTESHCFHSTNQTFRQTSAVQESKRNVKTTSTARHKTLAKEALEMHWKCTGNALEPHGPAIQRRQQSMTEDNWSGKQT